MEVGKKTLWIPFIILCVAFFGLVKIFFGNFSYEASSNPFFILVIPVIIIFVVVGLFIFSKGSNELANKGLNAEKYQNNIITIHKVAWGIFVFISVAIFLYFLSIVLKK